MENIIKHYKILLQCEKFVVTGSYALNKMGVYAKEAADLDILLLNPTPETVDLLTRLVKEAPARTKLYSKNMFIFMHEGVKIDVFTTYDSKDVITDLKVDDTFISKCNSIINAKKSYNRIKDWIQLRSIAKSICSPSEFNSFLDSQ